MPELDVINTNNEKVERIRLNEDLFGKRVINRPLIHEAFVREMASLRQGTASTKTRGEVRGGGKKPWRQKGTGRARAGSCRSPLWKGGGTVFGPRPRSYSYPFPRKMFRSALSSLLSSKVRDGELIILEDIEINEPKTGILANILKRLNLNNVLFVMGEDDNKDNLKRAARNISDLKIIPIRNLNIYDLLCYRYLLVLKGDIRYIEERFS